MSAAVKQSGLEAQARFDQLAWYYHRLRAMNGAEVAHRVGEAMKRRVSRFNRSGWAAFDMGDGEVPCLAPREGMMDQLAPELAAQWRAAAETAQRGDITLLGQTWPAEQGARRWHLDPVTGGTWPARAYCFDVPYRRERTLGDVKYVWELNRLQFLQPVAALAACEQDDALAAFCLAEIEDWMEANPPFRGVNWASGIELALRIVSLLVVVGLLGPERVPPAQRRKIRMCLNAHAYWLMRYPSRHSSANNHLIAEAGALFLLGTLWPELGIGDRAAAAHAVLIEEVGRQFHDDGVGAEQSPSYTAFTLEWYLLAADVAARVGDPFPKSVTKRLGEAGQFLRWIMDEGSNVPCIGDDDEGRVIASAPRAGGGYVASVLGSVAANLARPEPGAAAGRPLFAQSLSRPAVAMRVRSQGRQDVFEWRLFRVPPPDCRAQNDDGHGSRAARPSLHRRPWPCRRAGVVAASRRPAGSGRCRHLSLSLRRPVARSLPGHGRAQHAVPRRPEFEPHRRSIQLAPKSAVRADRVEERAGRDICLWPSRWLSRLARPSA